MNIELQNQTDGFCLAPILNLIDDIIIVINESHKVIFCNDAASRLLGISISTIIGKSAYDVMPKKQAKLIWDKDERVLNSWQPQEQSLNVVFGGRSNNTKALLLPFYDPVSCQRLVIRLIKIGDASTRRKNDQTHPPSSHLLPLPPALIRCFESSPHVNIMWKDLDSKVLWINNSCSQNLGFNQDELIGARFEEAANDPHLYAKWLREDATLIRTKRPVLGIFEKSSKEDSRWFRLDKIPVLDAQGEVASIVVIGIETDGPPLPAEAHRGNGAPDEDYKKRLEAAETALDVLIEKFERDKISLKEKYAAGIRNSVFHYIEMLKRMSLDQEAGQLIALIEQNLQKLSDPFTSNIASPFFKLSPMEIQVAQLVRDGKTNKEIASLLHLSKSTILTHRHHLRFKLGLKHQKKNLRSFLQTL